MIFEKTKNFLGENSKERIESLANLATAGAVLGGAVGIWLTYSAVQWNAENEKQKFQRDRIAKLEDRIYDYEKDTPSLLCLYGHALENALDCKGFTELNGNTAPYAEVVTDYVLSTLEFHNSWCIEPQGIFDDCWMMTDFAYEVFHDPHNVFRTVIVNKSDHKFICQELLTPHEKDLREMLCGPDQSAKAK